MAIAFNNENEAIKAADAEASREQRTASVVKSDYGQDGVWRYFVEADDGVPFLRTGELHIANVDRYGEVERFKSQ